MKNRHVNRSLWYVTALIALITLIACGSDDGSPHNHSEPKADPEWHLHTPFSYKGYVAVNDLLRQRVFSGEFNGLTSYFRVVGNDQQSLRSLLGYRSANGLEMHMEGNLPNSLNALIWMLAFNQVSSEVAQACEEQPEVKLFPELEDAIAPLCHNTATISENQARKLWFELLRYDAPQQQFENWFEYITGHEEVELQEALTAALVNPYFLMGR